MVARSANTSMATSIITSVRVHESHKETQWRWKAIQKWTDFLTQAYSKPQRHYHTLSPVYAMVLCPDKDRNLMEDLTAVQLAMLFHNWIYGPKAHDNYIQSFQVFETFAEKLNIADPLRCRASHYIEATITHSISARDQNVPDLEGFLDLDWGVLGRQELDYALHVTQIRNEYGYFSVTDYALGRVGVLESFLGRQILLLSDIFHATSEVSTRRNWKSKIVELKNNLPASTRRVLRSRHNAGDQRVQLYTQRSGLWDLIRRQIFDDLEGYEDILDDPYKTSGCTHRRRLSRRITTGKPGKDVVLYALSLRKWVSRSGSWLVTVREFGHNGGYH